MKEVKAPNKHLAIEILMRSFQANQSVNYIIKQKPDQLGAIKALMEYSIDVCSLFGDVWLSDDEKACALVLYPQSKRTTLRSIWLDLKLIFKAIGLLGIKKAIDRESKIKAIQPKIPMAYLWFIGVDPVHQHQGAGTALLRELLRDANAKGLPVYLETSTLTNLPWYKQIGFDVYDQLDLGYILYFLKRV